MKQLLGEAAETITITPKILYFGTPVILLSTLNLDGTTNLTPMSSAWALENRIVLGLGSKGHGLANLLRHGECVVNVASANLWKHVEALAPLTGANPVPEHKQGVFRHEKDKFTAAGLTSVQSQVVLPERVGECPLQIEAKVVNIQITGEAADFAIIEVESVVVHAHKDILLTDQHIAPTQWNPLIYNFRHYFGLGEELGKTFRAEV